MVSALEINQSQRKNELNFKYGTFFSFEFPSERMENEEF
jgi:hypothetical protein